MNILELIERHALDMCDDACWETTYTPNSHGYIRVKGLKLHRIAWEAHNAAPIPSGMCVCHTCDNRRCFNPAHLFLGTKGENNTDRHKKGRTVLNPPQRKYDYVVIHKMYSDGKTIAEIASHIGADWSTVERVIKEKLQ